MRQLKKGILPEGTEMGSIGGVDVKQFASKDGTAIQLTGSKGYVQLSREDAAKLAARLAKWAGSKNMARPGEYESVQESDCGCGPDCACGGNCGPDCNCQNCGESINEGTQGCADCEWISDETDGDITTCDDCAAEKREKTKEAVGEFAEPIYNLVDIEGEEAVLDELIRYLSGDQIQDFVADYKRHHDMDIDFDESKQIDELNVPNDKEKLKAQMAKLKQMASDAQAKGDHNRAYNIERSSEMLALQKKLSKLGEDTNQINHNNVVQLAGDSIWQGEKRGEPVTDTVNVGKISIHKDGDGYASVSVEHDGPWTIYTDTGFEDAISDIIGMPVSWSEQGMQEEGTAHLEADYGEGNESIRNKERTMEEVDRILQIAGIKKAPVAEEKESEKELDEAKKELDEEPNEGNEFSGELEKARKAGKKEFEVDGKKYKVESEETDEDSVTEDEEIDEDEKEELDESPTMDTTQLINLLKNSGISEEAINKKLDEWANTPAGVGEVEPTAHAGDANDDFAQAVNLSLKRYLDAQDMKVNVTESHTKEKLSNAYKNFKAK